MYNVSIFLHVVGFDYEKNEKCFVSTCENNYCPLIADISKDIDDSLEINMNKLFEQYIDMGAVWTKIKLIDAIKQDGILCLVYTTAIPPGTTLKNAYYINTNKCLIDRYARKSLSYV